MPPTPVKQSPRPTANGQQRKAGGVLDRIAPVAFEDEGIKMLLYGASGTGKTHLWATFPGPILAVVCSGGMNPGELRTLDAEQRRKTKQVILQKSGEITELVNHVREAGTFKTVVLDHASGLSDLILKEILGLDDYLMGKYRVAGKGESWSVVSQQQYGQLALQCKERFRELLNLPGNVVIIAQERTFNSVDDGIVSDVLRPTVGAALTPSVTGWLNPACDYVVQTFKRPRMVTKEIRQGNSVVKVEERGKGVDYCLRVEPHDVFMTKFRMPGGVATDVVVDPSYAKIMSLINGGKPKQ